MRDLSSLTISALLVVLTILVSPLAGASAIIWDWSPETTGGTVYSNSITNKSNGGTNHGESVMFSNDFVLEGMAIYGANSVGTRLPGRLGNLVVIRIWEDVLGSPGEIIARYESVVSELDLEGATEGNVRRYASLPTAFLLNQDTAYWVSMSGVDLLESTWLPLTGLRSIEGGDDITYLFFEDRFNGRSGFRHGDMSFRLYGQMPLPSTLLLIAPLLVYLFSSLGLRPHSKPRRPSMVGS